MNFYERWILPPILDLIMRQKHLTKYRRAVVAAARGRVLEIGVGSGLNFPLYGKQVELVYGIDPSPRLLAIARRRCGRLRMHRRLLARRRKPRLLQLRPARRRPKTTRQLTPLRQTAPLKPTKTFRRSSTPRLPD